METSPFTSSLYCIYQEVYAVYKETNAGRIEYVVCNAKNCRFIESFDTYRDAVVFMDTDLLNRTLPKRR